MRKTLLTATALAALFFAPALAEDVAPAPAPAPAASDTTQPPATDTAQAPAPDVKSPGAADTQVAEAPKAGEKFLAQQEETQLLASNLIGSSVYSAADENLGDINDLVFTKEGKIDAVVIGVGGFLGMGEKNVAISFATLQESTDENGGMKLVIDATADELSQAPAFETVAMLKQKKLDEQNQPTELSPTPPAPEPAPAPAPAQ